MFSEKMDGVGKVNLIPEKRVLLKQRPAKSKVTKEEGKEGKIHGKKVDSWVDRGICDSKDQSLWETVNKIARRKEQ